jgi:hypothetical protein
VREGTATSLGFPRFWLGLAESGVGALFGDRYRSACPHMGMKLSAPRIFALLTAVATTACGGAVQGSQGDDGVVTFNFELEARAQTCRCGANGALATRVTFAAAIVNQSAKALNLQGAPTFVLGNGMPSARVSVVGGNFAIAANDGASLRFETIVEDEDLYDSVNRGDPPSLSGLVVFPTSLGELSPKVDFALVR